MPLPAALLARLAKRGLVEQSKTEQRPNKGLSKPGTEEHEEVFAEDYDDPSKPEKVEVPPQPDPVQAQLQFEPVMQAAQELFKEESVFFETTACPHRENPYHECLAYCRKRYGMRDWDPDEDSVKKRDRMIHKHPLPAGWLEVGDCDSGRYYYWNVNTDEVSWLSPTHPKAQVTRSAEKLGLVGKVGNLDSEGEEEEEEPMQTNVEEEEEPESDSGSDTSLSDEEDFIDKRGKIRDRGRLADIKRGGKKEEIDPMDPSSYSDIPRGGWTDGLDTRGKAKTGVDVTASGPLFQQRPYPSPGDIMRANQSLKKKK